MNIKIFKLSNNEEVMGEIDSIDACIGYEDMYATTLPVMPITAKIPSLLRLIK